jgi:hypothetical protein
MLSLAGASEDGVSAVTVCAMLSSLVQVTLVPTLTVTVPGLNAKSLIVTVFWLLFVELVLVESSLGISIEAELECDEVADLVLSDFRIARSTPAAIKTTTTITTVVTRLLFLMTQFLPGAYISLTYGGPVFLFWQ